MKDNDDAPMSETIDEDFNMEKKMNGERKMKFVTIEEAQEIVKDLHQATSNLETIQHHSNQA